jgi:hypothetical protein
MSSTYLGEPFRYMPAFDHSLHEIKEEKEEW